LTGKKIDYSCKDCNVVFVSFDTLREDHTSYSGYVRNTTPNIDKFTKSGFVFTNTISVSSWTLPSSMSWFTGVYPSKHKVTNKYTVLPSGEEEITNLSHVSPNLKTLAEVFKENGYLTGGFTGGAGVHRQFGFDKGFDVYIDDKDFAGFEYTYPKAIEWIKQNKDKKLFVFLHGYNIHGQYEPPGGYDKRFVDFEYKGKLTGSKDEQKDLREEGLSRGQIYLTKDDVRFLTDLYDEKIQRADELFSKFIREYKQLGLIGKTVFVLTSDHGEELYDHGQIDHGHNLYDELIKVPLIITSPYSIRARKIDSQVSSIDIPPTILDLLGLLNSSKMSQQLQGKSLISLIKGEKVLRDVFSETDYRYAVFLRSIRTSDRWKLIKNLEQKLDYLFNLNTDKDEKNNQSTKENIKLNDLNNIITKYLD